MKLLSFLGHFFIMCINIVTGLPVGQYAQIAIDLLEVVKKVVASNSADEIVKLIPGTWDDNILEQVRKALFNTLSKLNYDNVTGEQSLADLIKHIADDLSKCDPRYVSAYIHNIASQLLRELTENGMKKSEADLLIQMIYTKFKETNTETISTATAATTTETAQAQGSNDSSANSTVEENSEVNVNLAELSPEVLDTTLTAMNKTQLILHCVELEIPFNSSNTEGELIQFIKGKIALNNSL
jgi:hypothetical protein